jgi:hypothetical protein
MHGSRITNGVRSARPEERSAPAGPRHHFRSLVLGWTDPDSGDRYDIDLAAGSELVEGLRSAGFEVVEGAPPGAHDTASGSDLVAGRIDRAMRPRAGGRVGDPRPDFAASGPALYRSGRR